MKIKSAIFELSAPDLKSCPQWALPEFAFIGRSNVGKSSLINLLAGKAGLALVSDLPGKTKLINFFIVNGSWSLVDLPGYGYADVSQKSRDSFNRSVSDYLEKRKNLFCVFVLIDSRLAPQPIDLEFLRWLVGCGTPFALVFTKTDKLSADRVRRHIDSFRQSMAQWCEDPPKFFASSARTRAGRLELLDCIGQVLAENNRS